MKKSKLTFKEKRKLKEKKKEKMKKLLGILILGLLWCGNANAYDCLLTGDNGNYKADLCLEYNL